MLGIFSLKSRVWQGRRLCSILQINDKCSEDSPGVTASLQVVYETIDHYLRNGSIVYGVLMDCTKAFDTIQHSKLFKKLLEAGVPPVVVRLFIFIYQNQMASVRWNNDQ